ncbi:Remorin 4.1, partial [Cucurbita argyrosperma subsp. sororia]
MQGSRVKKLSEMGFREQTALSRPAFRARDSSPDSVIYALESSFSLFSSASASVERCSFASEAHDRDSLISEISLHLAGHDEDPEQNKPALSNKHSRQYTNGEKAKDESNVDLDDENRTVDSARNSFSLALKECQDHRSRSKAQSSKLDEKKPASLDLNNANTASSPRLTAVKKNVVVTTHKTATFPSPGTPSYRHNSFSMPKGWSSERVPLQNNGGRKHTNNPALLTLNSGRTLPSKWEDAERWIFSPLSGDGVVKTSAQRPQQRPKSKSGPLGPPGTAYYSMYSPAAPAYEGGTFRNFITESPFSAGVVSTNGLAVHSGGHEGSFHGQTEPSMARSVSVHGCSEMSGQLSSTTGLQEGSRENLATVKNSGTDVSRVVSRRDVATQMSPEDSMHSSPRTKSSITASTSSAMHMFELGAVTSSKLDIRDVQVDNQVATTRWSKKHKGSFPRKDSLDYKRKNDADVASRCPDLDIPIMGKSISKVKREEAKIAAWENLQKAKADAAIRKLEMKLEKKRASSMHKILNKLKSAQKKAQEMRNSVMGNQSLQDNRTSSFNAAFYQIDLRYQTDEWRGINIV